MRLPAFLSDLGLSSSSSSSPALSTASWSLMNASSTTAGGPEGGGGWPSAGAGFPGCMSRVRWRLRIVGEVGCPVFCKASIDGWWDPEREGREVAVLE